MIFWGGTFISGRMLAGHVPPFIAAFLRFATAATILLIVLYRRNGRLPTVPGRLLLPIICLSLTGVFSYNLFFFWGLQSVTASRASVIIANNPVFIAVFASLIFRERLGLIKSLGVPISVIGAVTAISKGDVAGLLSGGLGWGDLMIFGCVMSWVAFSLMFPGSSECDVMKMDTIFPDMGCFTYYNPATVIDKKAFSPLVIPFGFDETCCLGRKDRGCLVLEEAES